MDKDKQRKAAVAAVAAASVVGLAYFLHSRPHSVDTMAGTPSNASAAAPSQPETPRKVYYPAEEGHVSSMLVHRPELVVSLSPDGSDGMSQLQNVRSPVYMSATFSGCQPNKVWSLSSAPSLNSDDVMAWLIRHNLVAVQQYTINVLNSGGGLTPTTFFCPIVQEAVRQFLPADQQNVDIHHGIGFPLAYRMLMRFTYENEYDTQTPGMGNVKVYAATFSYALMTRLPGVSFSGPGTGSVKMYLNPDNGQWTTADYQQQDPTIALQ